MRTILILFALSLALFAHAEDGVTLWGMAYQSFDVPHLRTDPDFKNENLPRFQRWSEILKAEYPARPVQPLAANLHLAAELTAAEWGGETRQLRQLRALVEQGYNGVVAVYAGDALGLIGAIDRARSAGMTHVMLAWSPLPERTKASIFPAPDKLAADLKLIAPNCDSFAVGWRKTSLHFMRREVGYTDYLIQAVRGGNPEIAVVGELYAAACETVRRVTVLAPAINRPASAAALLAVGYAAYPAATRVQLLDYAKITDRVLHVGFGQTDDITLFTAPIAGQNQTP